MVFNAFKQLLNRRDREKHFTCIPSIGALQKDMLCSGKTLELIAILLIRAATC